MASAARGIATLRVSKQGATNSILVRVMAWRRQAKKLATAWVNADAIVCRHMASLGHTEF